MKKVLSVLMILVLFFTVVGCSNDQSKGGSENEKVTIWAWDPNFNIAIMEKAKDIYLQDNPNVEFEIVDMAKSDLEQTLQTILASGVRDALPDIVLVEDYNAQKYLKAYPGSFADLTNEINYDHFLPYKVGLMTVDGRTYGVPFDTGASGFYYRTDYLAAAGYEASDLQSLTWDDFIEIGKDVKAATGKEMLAFETTDGGLMRIMMQSAGAWYFNEDGEVNLVNNPAVIEAVETYKKIVDANITKPTSGWGEWVGAFNSGDVASVTTGVWITGSVKAEESQSGLWAVAPTPRLNVSGSVNASNLGGSSWYVLEASESKAVAIDFLRTVYAGNVDFYNEILVERGAVGSYIPSHTASNYAAEDPFFGGQAIFEDFTEWMTKIPVTDYGENTYEVDNAIFAVLPNYLNGSVSLEETLTRAEAQARSAIR